MMARRQRELILERALPLKRLLVTSVLPIRSINFLFPEFQAAYRAPSLILADAE